MASGCRSGSLLLLVLAAGCGQGELPGNYFNVTVTGADNLCTGNGTAYTDNFEYRLEIVSPDVSVAMEDAVWASGLLDGCNLSYTSLPWTDYRDGYEIRWKIDGEALINASGGTGCVNDNGLDWVGTETFLITESNHPSVSAGCTYTLDVVGKFEREVK